MQNYIKYIICNNKLHHCGDFSLQVVILSCKWDCIMCIWGLWGSCMQLYETLMNLLKRCCLQNKERNNCLEVFSLYSFLPSADFLSHGWEEQAPGSVCPPSPVLAGEVGRVGWGEPSSWGRTSGSSGHHGVSVWAGTKRGRCLLPTVKLEEPSWDDFTVMYLLFHEGKEQIGFDVSLLQFFFFFILYGLLSYTIHFPLRT